MNSLAKAHGVSSPMGLCLIPYVAVAIEKGSMQQLNNIELLLARDSTVSCILV
jgi:hypothetical protein